MFGNRLKIKTAFILPTSFFCIIAVISIIFFTGCYKNGDLVGVTTDIKQKPMATYTTVMDGTFQVDYANWFNLNFPFRDKFVRGYNQFYYDIMGESGNKTLTIGDHLNIYEVGQIERILNPSKAQYGVEYYETYAYRLKYIQDQFAHMGKEVFFIITPNKPEIVSEDIPLRYQLMAEPNCKDFAAHFYLRRALENKGINFYDTTDTMLRLKKEHPDFVLYPKTGTHWTYLACLYCIQDAFDTYFNQTGVVFPKPKAEVYKTDRPYYGTDIDMSELLNVFHARKDDFYYRLNITHDMPENYVKENAVIFGTSYSEQICHIFQADEMFNKLTSIRYLLYIFESDGNQMKFLKNLDNKISEQELSEIIDNNKYFFFEVQSTDLVPTHSQLVEQIYNLVKDRKIFDDKDTISKLEKSEKNDKFYLSDKTSNVEIIVDDKEITVDKKTKEITVPAKLINNTGQIIKTNGENIICLAYHIKEGKTLKEGRWSSLPDTINPSKEIDVSYTLEVPKTPGVYEVRLSMVQEKIAWLEDVNSNYPIVIKLIVR